MEYLMTYGWAILIIAVVLGTLFQLGVFNSSSFSPRAPPGACQVFRPSGPGTTTNINLMGVCTGQLPQYVAQFNGASSLINVGNASSLKPTAAITISAWINSNGKGRNGYGGIYSGIGGYNPSYSRLFILDSGQLLAQVFINGAKQDVYGASLQNNQWHQVVYRYNGSTEVWFADGVKGSDYSKTGSINTNVFSELIGQGYGSTLYYDFNGSISNVQIYNTSLTANQIQALYLEGIGGAPMKLQNLAGWWPLNGNSNDYSGNNNNGVPINTMFTSQYGK